MAVACGSKNTLIVDTDGFLQGCGSLDTLILGSENTSGSQGLFMPVWSNTPKLRLVSMCGENAAIVSDNGDLCLCGNATVLSSNGGHRVQRRCNWFRVNRDLLGGEAVEMVDVGVAQSTAILTQSGSVYLLHNDCFGNLHTQYQTPDVMIRFSRDLFNNENIVMVSMGFDHCVALSDSGNVYTWGDSDFGQLGHNDGQPHRDPKLIPPTSFQYTPGQNEKVVFVTAFGNSTMAVTEEGHLFAFGSDLYGNLGVSGMPGAPAGLKRESPTPVSSFDNSRVVMAAMGPEFSLVVTDDGALWACGKIRRWQDTQSHDSVIRFERVAACADVRIVTAAIGSDHWVALTDQGDIFSFGNNDHGQTGLLPDVEKNNGLGKVTGKKAGRFVELPFENKLTFAMGTHNRLGGGQEKPETTMQSLKYLFGFWKKRYQWSRC